MYLNKNDICALLNNRFNGFSAFIASLSDHRFSVSPGGKWSAGQHLDHLVKSVRPLIAALGLPRPLLRLYGKPLAPSLPYDQLAERYQRALSNGATTPRAFMPGIIYLPQRAGLLRQWEQQRLKLQQLLQGWQEEGLDAYVLPHPLLGKITMREMLYFTAYHIHHHQDQLQRQEQLQHTWEHQLEQIFS